MSVTERHLAFDQLPISVRCEVDNIGDIAFHSITRLHFIGGACVWLIRTGVVLALGSFRDNFDHAWRGF